MLKAIVQTKNPGFWILIHVLLGFAFSLFNFLFIIYFAILFFSSVNLITQGSNSKKILGVIYFITYSSSLELISRMTKAHQYKLPWEFGKYVVFFGSIYAILALNTKKGVKGFLLFFLLLPGMFFSAIGDIKWHDIVFNLLGPISVAFIIIAFTKVKITKQQFRQILKLLLYPAITVLAYTYIKTPDLDSIDFVLGANFQVTAGYGSNQVSTILGLGFFLTFLFWVNRWPLTGYRKVDMFIMMGFAFQGLLSFSRGGMIGGVVGIIAFLYILTRSNVKQKKKYSLPKIGKYVLPALFGLVVAFQIADIVTDGLLTHRYKGETTNSLLGKTEINLNSITTGRFNIFESDLELWYNHFIMGVGVGVSSILREGGQISHVEFSRLLAEHGLFGLTYFLLLLLIGAKLMKNRTNAKYQGILVAFFAIAIYTTFHAATRTYITPLLIGISLVNIVDIKEPDSV